jgi:hypothetical protein
MHRCCSVTCMPGYTDVLAYVVSRHTCRVEVKAFVVKFIMTSASTLLVNLK